MNALPKGWTTVALGDVATLERRTIDPHTLDASTPYLGLEHIDPGGVLKPFSTLAKAGVTSSKVRFAPDHVLVGKLRPYLAKITTVPYSGVASTDILPLMPGEWLEKQYLLHFLRQPRIVETLNNMSSGANLPRLNPRSFMTLRVPLPSLDEQRRIAAILDKAMSLVEAWGHRVVRTTELIPSMFNSVPSDSAQYRLSELGDFSGGITLGPKRNGFTKHLPYLRVANVMRGHLVLDEIKSAGVSEKEAHKKSLCPGDLLIVEGHGRLEEIGRAAMWQNEIPAITHQNHLFRFRCENSRVLPEYLMGYLNSSAGRKAIQRLATTTSGLNTLSGKKLKTLEVPVPDLVAQRKYVSQYTQSRKHILALDAARARAQSLLESLGSRAFSGSL